MRAIEILDTTLRDGAQGAQNGTAWSGVDEKTNTAWRRINAYEMKMARGL